MLSDNDINPVLYQRESFASHVTSGEKKTSL